jgi:hypothetical protein
VTLEPIDNTRFQNLVEFSREKHGTAYQAVVIVQPERSGMGRMRLKLHRMEIGIHDSRCETTIQQYSLEEYFIWMSRV